MSYNISIFGFGRNNTVLGGIVSGQSSVELAQTSVWGDMNAAISDVVELLEEISASDTPSEKVVVVTKQDDGGAYVVSVVTGRVVMPLNAIEVIGGLDADGIPVTDLGVTRVVSDL